MNDKEIRDIFNSVLKIDGETIKAEDAIDGASLQQLLTIALRVLPRI